MLMTGSVVRRQGEAHRRPPLEDQQQLPRPGRQGGQPLTDVHYVESKHVAIERHGPVHVIDVERGFEDAVEWGWHSGSLFAPAHGAGEERILASPVCFAPWRLRALAPLRL